MAKSRTSTARKTEKAHAQARHQEASLDDVLASNDEFAGAAEASRDADALLASMADDAIDRMLSGRGASQSFAADDFPDLAAENDDSGEELISDAERSALEDIARPAPEATAPLPSSEAELDAFLAGGSRESSQSAADLLGAELEADARQSPAGPISHDRNNAAARSSVDVEASQSSCALWLLPLVWLNAPLNRAPPAVRDAIGKVALITLLNAIGLFIYGVFRGYPLRDAVYFR